MASPQAGKLANEFLQKKLAPHGYYEVKHTPGLWKYITRPIQFTLVVDNFGVKYTRGKDVEHLLGILEKKLSAVSIDWDGALYCVIPLDWNYKERWLDISMLGYIKRYCKDTCTRAHSNRSTLHMVQRWRNMAKMPTIHSPPTNPPPYQRRREKGSREL